MPPRKDGRKPKVSFGRPPPHEARQPRPRRSAGHRHRQQFGYGPAVSPEAKRRSAMPDRPSAKRDSALCNKKRPPPVSRADGGRFATQSVPQTKADHTRKRRQVAFSLCRRPHLQKPPAPARTLSPEEAASPRERPFPRKPPAPARTHASSAAPSTSHPRPWAQLRKLHQDGAAAEADTGAARTKGRGRRGRSLSRRLARGVTRDPSLRRTQLREPLAIHRRDARAAIGAARPRGAAVGADRPSGAAAGAARPCSAAAGDGIAAQPRLPHGSPSTPYSHCRRTAALLP